MSPAASSRWCPTPEQLMILEEMYRGGVRTPSASQIQQITAHLSFYGRIEGKNVFYWFQNHKARDRQRLRRKLSKQLHQQELYHQQQQNHHCCHHHHHLLHYFDNQFSSSPAPPPPPPTPPALPQLSLYSPLGFLPQGGVEHASTQTMSDSWNKADHFPERFEMDKSVAGSNGRDWMIMPDVGSTTPCYNKPLKTLELFPITATGLKQESPTPENIPSTN